MVVGESWRRREERRRQAAREARLLDPEPASWWPRAVLVGATVLWVATLAWLAATLPARVPTHWSFGGTPDGWSSRGAAMAMAVLLPLGFVYPMLLISRLVLTAPQAVNAPYKEWWLETPRRLRRFERLVREDLMVIVGLTVLLMTAIDLITGYAAHQPGGRVPGWWFLAVTLGFLAAIAVLTVRMLVGRRYRPRDEEPELADQLS
jgi:uncharacterized membrane protein